MDRVKMAFRDEDSILDQIYKKEICSDFYHDYISFSKNIQIEAHKSKHSNPIFREFLVVEYKLNFKYVFSSKTII